MTDIKEKLTSADLAGFTGTENYYRHALSRAYTYTDGVKYMAEKAGAYWLIDVVVSHQHNPRVRREEFQVWKLKLNKTGHGTMVTCEDGNGHRVTQQRIQFTDFPLPEITLWLENNVVMLPSER